MKLNPYTIARQRAHEQVSDGGNFTADLHARLHGAPDHRAPGLQNPASNSSNAAPSYAETVSLLYRGRP